MELLQANPKAATTPKIAVPRQPRRVGLITLSFCSFISLGVGLMLGFWGALSFFVATPVAETTETITKTATATSFNQALDLIRTARRNFAQVRDYKCLYLRDEMVDGQMQMNTMALKVRHEPFSVAMEWLGPAQKKGRRVVFVQGKNDNKMLVKHLVTLKLDPQESIKRKESRHTIQEAGILNLINRYERSWEKEQSMGITQLSVEEKTETIKLGEQAYTHVCSCVTSTHPIDSRNTFEYYIAKVYFDKTTGLPIRTEGFEFPSDGHPEGRLMERYTYLDLKLNPGLTEADFTLK